MKKITTGAVLVALACLFSALGAGFAIYLRPADASRNSAGTMSGVNGPFTAGQVIASSLLNNRYADIETEITNSLDRSGRGGMLAALRGVAGTNTAPAFSFTSDTTTGFYNPSAAVLASTFNGTEGARFISTGIRVANGVVATPSLSFLNDTGSGLYRAGSNDIRLAINGADVASFNSAVTTTNNIAQFFAPSLANGSTTRVWTGKSTSATAGGFMSFTPNATAALSTTCLDVAGQSSTLCVDGNGLTTVNNRINIGVGVSADGSGFKHKRGTAGCVTAASTGATCLTTVTWTTAFADTNYTPVCVGIGVTSGLPVIQVVNNSAAASAQVATVAVTAVAAQFTTISCIAVHD